MVSHRRFRHTEAQRHRDYVNVAWLWGVRVARAMRATGRATGRSQAEQRPHAACDRRAARPIGPARWAGRHPLMSPSEHMRLRVSAVCDQSSSCAVDRTLASWILGASAPRCVVDSVRSGPAADPLNKYVGSWEMTCSTEPGRLLQTSAPRASRRAPGSHPAVRIRERAFSTELPQRPS